VYTSSMPSFHRTLVLTIAVLLVTACGSSSGSRSADDRPPRRTPTAAPIGPAMATQNGMYGDRYCELLLVQPGTVGLRAQVYGTYTLNDCPQATWAALDTGAIARAENVPFAQRNGLHGTLDTLRGGRPLIGLNTGAGGRWVGKQLSIERTIELAVAVHQELRGRVTFLVMGGEPESARALQRHQRRRLLRR